MSKLKASLLGQIKRDPVHKKTSQGSGRGSRPSHGRKPSRGQGR